MDSHLRSIAKTLSWRLVATVITFVVAFILTGRLAVAVEIGVADTLIKLGAYYGHERAWSLIRFGRKRNPDYYI